MRDTASHGKLKEDDVRRYLKTDSYSVSEEFQQSLQILIALLYDLSGGVIKLGDICTLSKIKRFEDFQVVITLIYLCIASS